MDRPGYMQMTPLERITALEQMLRSPGWAIMRTFLEAQVTHLTDEYVAKSIDPNLLLRTGGAIAQTKTIMAWPELQLAAWKKQDQKQQAKDQSDKDKE